MAYWHSTGNTAGIERGTLPVRHSSLPQMRMGLVETIGGYCYAGSDGRHGSRVSIRYHRNTIEIITFFLIFVYDCTDLVLDQVQHRANPLYGRV
jgi:hypothetical protein